VIALARAILQAFLADRMVAALTLAAPVAFFTLLAFFYQHLESSDGLQFDVVLVDNASTDDSRAFIASMVQSHLDHVRVSEISPTDPWPINALAVVQIAPEFSRLEPTCTVYTEAPLPGSSDAVVQLIELGMQRAFAMEPVRSSVTVISRPGMLLRGSAAGIALVFVLFSASSIAARGLGDDAQGLPERLRSVGVGRASLAFARILVMTAIAWGQVALTLVWAAAVFGVIPASPAALAVAASLGVLSCTTFVALLAAIVGSRTRFAAVAPVVILALSAVSGGMIPRMLLPESVAYVGNLSFLAWAIDATSAAVNGQWATSNLAMLAAFVVACAIGTVVLSKGGDR
jgi:hypothetical protein